MNEAELHRIKIRLRRAERQKTARDEQRLPLPAGLIHNRDDSVTFNPDEEVRACGFRRRSVIGGARGPPCRTAPLANRARLHAQRVDHQ